MGLAAPVAGLVAVARWSGQPSNWVAPCGVVQGMRSLFVSFAFVNTSGSGLPLASVSKGTAGGMLVPRSRTYCDAATAEMRNVITRNVEPSTGEVTVDQAEAPLPLNVRRSAAVVFFAAVGTPERSAGIVPSSCNQAVLRGHSPA